MATVLQTQLRRSEREQVFDEFRRWGYLEANLDPLGHLQPQARPELEIPGKDAEEARRYYCGTIGSDFMHIPDAERREWIQHRIESRPAAPDRGRGGLETAVDFIRKAYDGLWRSLEEKQLVVVTAHTTALMSEDQWLLCQQSAIARRRQL